MGNDIMEKGDARQQSRRMRTPREVAIEMSRVSNMAAATGREDIADKMDLLCVEWLVVRGLEVEIKQDHSGQSVEVAKTA